MAARRVALPAKLSAPRLAQAVPRERLHAWLDAHREQPGIWISGQPGAGKTMLVADYARTRGMPCLWYRLDADDNDMGRFFSMLALAGRSIGTKAKLPPFAAEHLTQPLPYARAWFRAAFGALPRPLLLVFDNLEQAALPLLPQLLACALQEAPEGVCLLMTSRHAPPPELSAAALAGTLAVLAPQQLDFNAAEARSYADAVGLDETVVRAAAQRVGGWAAGLRLLSHSPQPLLSDAPLLFDYFAGLLHQGLSAPVQRLLQVGALLPWIPSALAAELAEVPDAAAQLERLATQNLFTERAAQGVYRLHPLLRDYLVQRGRQDLAPAVRQGLLRRAVEHFAQAGHIDAAIDLAFDAGDAEHAVALWLTVLEAKLAQGQLDQLEAWADRAPEACLHQLPYALYGRARVCFLREDAGALDYYELACSAFVARGDVLGQQLCAAGVLEWRYNSDSFVDHQRWCGLLSGAASGAPTCEEHALRLVNGELLASFFCGDFHHHAALTQRVLALLTRGGAENDKLSLAITLLGCLERDKRWDDAQQLADKMEALLQSPRLGPRVAILVRQQIASDLHRQTGDYTEARRLALVARAQAAEHGFAVLEFEAVAILLLCALYMGDAGETQQLLAQLAPMTAPGNIYHQRFSRQTRAWHELHQGRLAQALAHALRAAVDGSDMPARFRATWLLLAVFVRFAEGQHEQACDELEQFSALAEAGSRETLQANLLSLRAWCDWQAGQPDAAAALLAEAWSLAASVRYYQLLAPLRQTLVDLAGFALQRGICVVFARELIHRRRLTSPTAAAVAWPWPLRIYTLGRFELHADDVPLVFAGKVPRKPLALLKALVAFGGQSVALHRLTDALWPDDEADAAHDAFNVALHRLRKLLPRGTEALVLHEGCLSLNAQLWWTDARAFERLVSCHGGAVAPTSAVESLQQALALYGGHFLADEAEAPWSLSMRERLRGKFNQAVQDTARALEAAGRHEDAIACYRQGLEIDDLDEQFYQGVMRCALQLRRPAEGLAAYQRLKRTLSILLGVAPSARSEALHLQLRSSGGLSSSGPG